MGVIQSSINQAAQIGAAIYTQTPGYQQKEPKKKQAKLEKVGEDPNLTPESKKEVIKLKKIANGDDKSIIIIAVLGKAPKISPESTNSSYIINASQYINSFIVLLFSTLSSINSPMVYYTP